MRFCVENTGIFDGEDIVDHFVDGVLRRGVVPGGLGIIQELEQIIEDFLEMADSDLIGFHRMQCLVEYIG